MNKFSFVQVLTYCAILRSFNVHRLRQSANNYYGGNMTPSAILTVTGPSGEQQRQQIRESWQQSTISNGGSGAFNSTLTSSVVNKVIIYYMFLEKN